MDRYAEITVHAEEAKVERHFSRRHTNSKLQHSKEPRRERGRLWPPMGVLTEWQLDQLPQGDELRPIAVIAVWVEHTEDQDCAARLAVAELQVGADRAREGKLETKKQIPKGLLNLKRVRELSHVAVDH